MKIPFDKSSAKQIAEICIVSNTPNYLFKHLRRHPVVEQIAERYGSDAFLECASELAKKTDLVPEDELFAYVLVCALSRKSASEANKSFDLMRKLPIRWIESLVHLAKLIEQRDTISKVDLAYRTKPKFFDSRSTTGMVKTSVEMKPLIITHP